MAKTKNKIRKIITKSAKETQKLAIKFAREFRGGEVICLYGNLGSGKTTLVQGLAKELGIKNTVNSPSFVLEKQYATNFGKIKKLIHYDFYRLKDWREAEYLGIKDQLGDRKNLTIIEWPERIEKLLPERRWNLYFRYLNDDRREIKIEPPAKIHAVIFDLDEVLVDYFKTTGISSHQKIAKNLGLKIPTAGEIQKVWGLPWKEFIHTLWPKASVEKFRREYLARPKDYIAPLLPGAKRILEFLASKKIILGLITSRDRDLLLGQLGAVNIKKYFDFLISAEDSRFHKPDPRVFIASLKILKKYKIDKNEIIYIGDSLKNDFLPARQAGIKFLALTTGHYSKKDFLLAGLDKAMIFPNLHELLSNLKKI